MLIQVRRTRCLHRRVHAAPLTAGTLAAGVALLVAFAVTQNRVTAPLLPPGIVAHRSRGGAYLAFLLVMVGMFGMFLLVSFYLQTVAGYTALRAGVAFLPFAVAVLLASTLVGRVMTRVRSGLPLAAGLLLAASGMGWLTQLEVGGGYLSRVLPALVLIGFGLGTLSPVAANLATFQVPEREAGVASGVFNASEQIGASIGLAVLSTIAATSTDAYLAAHPATAAGQLTGVVHGYTVATTWAAAILAIGAVVVAALVNARLGDAASAQPGASPEPVAGSAAPAHRDAHRAAACTEVVEQTPGGRRQAAHDGQPVMRASHPRSERSQNALRTRLPAVPG